MLALGLLCLSIKVILFNNKKILSLPINEKTQRPREVKQLPQGHAATKWQCWDSNSRLPEARAALPIILSCVRFRETII